MSDAFTVGRRLAERHRRGETVETVIDLPNLSERPRPSGWTLRSALVRFAQPEPLRSAVIMELSRRAEAALQPVQNQLVDGHLVDLARLVSPDAEPGGKSWAAVDGYRSVVDLDPVAEEAVPLVSAILLLDDLGDRLARWAPSAPKPGPVDDVDATCHELRRWFELLAVPIESGPPGPGRGRRR